MGSGILLKAKRGDHVLQGDLLATLYTEDSDLLIAAKEELLAAYVYADTPPKAVPLIYDVIR